MQTPPENSELVLRYANRKLAELLDTDPLPLSTGGGRALEDALWVWGVLGGKDVGKSTLINALAGGDVVDRGEDVGEGTLQPAAYLTESDLEALRARFADRGSTPVVYHPDAPTSMRNLALVDLPDFDSLYAGHVETVRRIAGVLDGVIWVTTPKKLGDLRAIREIRRVLKARTNFAYVVNKVDWLLAQTDRPPEEELNRAACSLRAQIAECDSDDAANRSFLIAAKYGTARSMLTAITDHRGAPEAGPSSRANGALRCAVDALLNDFERLRTALTTTPTAEAAEANKRANLCYQIRTQARQLLDHHNPRAVIERLRRALDPGALEELADRFFPHVYSSALAARLNCDRALVSEWSTKLFKRRIAYWPLLGLIAWPAALAGTLLSGLRAVVPGALPTQTGDPFRFDGLSLEERAGGLLAGMRARLAGAADRLKIDLVTAEDLTRQCRGDVLCAVEEHRSAVMAPQLARCPRLGGRVLRWLLPVGVLIWFLLAQPVLSAFLGGLSEGAGLNFASLRAVVQALSGANVLVGLAVSLLILAMLVAAVYSRSVRDASAALETLRRTGDEAVTGPLRTSMIGTVTRPVETALAQLTELAASLERLAHDRPVPDKH